jgi:hypothetical protein
LVFAVIIIGGLLIFIFLKRHKKKKNAEFERPDEVTKNRILLFGEFKAIDNKGDDVADLFTPKVKELFLFVLIYSLKSGIGANVRDINDVLWEGISSGKVANNRSVTLKQTSENITPVCWD